MRSPVYTLCTRVALTLVATLLAASAAGDELSRPGNADARVVTASDENVLWVAVIRESGSVLYRRPAGGEFDFGRKTNRGIHALSTFDGDAVAVFDDGSIYRYGAGRIDGRPEAILPDRALPIDLLDTGARLYAVISSAAAARLTRHPRGENEQPVPFQPGGAPLSIALYDHRDWYALAPCPTEVVSAPTDRLQPRLSQIGEKLVLIWRDADALLWSAWDERRAAWQSPQHVSAGAVAGYWATVVSRVPTLTLVRVDREGRENVEVLRLLSETAVDGAASWRPAALRLSSLPDGTSVRRYERATGFNQHVVLLGMNQDAQPLLQFARVGDAPTEETVELLSIFEQHGRARMRHDLFQAATFFAVLMIMLGLFALRRATIFTPAALPGGMSPALAVQRLVGWLIDFAPITIATAAAQSFSWRDGIASLTDWVIGASRMETLPDAEMLRWWAVSVVVYAAYALLMELLFGRTVGKMLTGTWIASEAGARPAFWQIILRNAIRLVELIPQFWVFGLLVIVSRNRQRLGDIFARTVVVRATPGERAETTDSGARDDAPRDDQRRDDQGQGEGKSGSDS